MKINLFTGLIRWLRSIVGGRLNLWGVCQLAMPAAFEAKIYKIHLGFL